jgi:polyphosphate kinase
MPENLFFNRELSWLEFNRRVLYEGSRKDSPLLERLRFLGITGENFNEFFMLRVAALKRELAASPQKRDASGLTPAEQLSLISRKAHEIDRQLAACLNHEVLPALSDAGFSYVPAKQYDLPQKLFVSRYFDEEVFPLLTPLRIEGAQFPPVANLRLHIAFSLKLLPGVTPPERQGELFTAPTVVVAQFPPSLSRVARLPSPENAFTLLDDIIAACGTKLFPGYTVEETLIFRLIRAADFEVDEDAGDSFIHAMEEILVQRQLSFPVCLCCGDTSENIRRYFQSVLNLSDSDVYQISGLADPASLSGIVPADKAAPLSHPAWKSYYPPETRKDKPLWDTLRQRDVLLNLPYQAFEPVLSFIRDAAVDPEVLAIKMTLYRTSGNSPAIDSLEQAARNGKQVTVFVELKARFDEKRNIAWAERLERAGVIVIYGIVGLKLHAKILLIVRRESEGIRRYVHFSTGNYNEKTAQIYSDLSVFTAHEEIAGDATLFFNIVSGYSALQTMKQLALAPATLKARLVSLIEREIAASTPDNPGLIMAKMNSLCHEEIIALLYRASQAGVEVRLNVRGICTLVPGAPDLSERISVVSIVDHYLEHSRIFYFRNAGQEELYLSSADWMPRNLDRRLELLFPVLQKDTFDQVKRMLTTYFKDNCKSYDLQSDGSWTPNEPGLGEKPFRAQEKLHDRAKKAAELDAALQKEKLEFVARRK